MHTSLTELLNTLLSYGPKLPEILASIQRIVDVVTEEGTKIARLIGIEKAASEVQLTAEEEALIQQFYSGEGHAGPIMDSIRSLILFLKEHPELISVILKFIK